MNTLIAKGTFGLIALLLFTAASAESLIDPMRPAFAPSKPGAAPRAVVAEARVTAIFLSGDRRVAVFDGRVVKAGDRIGDTLIQEVMVDGVRYARGGRIETARLPKQAAAVRGDVGAHRIAQESKP